VRWTYENPEPERGQEIVEINLYSPADAASVLIRLVTAKAHVVRTRLASRFLGSSTSVERVSADQLYQC
jgi:hypothetical protein